MAAGRGHIIGIDYLRAAMSLFVVIWHASAAGTSGLFSRAGVASHVFTVSDLINFHVLLLAVPTFILISNYLFVCRDRSARELMQRTGNLLFLLCSWTVAFLLFRFGFDGLEALVPRSPSHLLFIVFGAAGTDYYFFISLAVSLTVAYLFRERPTKAVVTGLLASLVLLILFPIAGRYASNYLFMAYWSPLNFVPYSFAAILLRRYAGVIEERRAWIIVAALLLSAAFALYEWRFHVHAGLIAHQGYALPAYTRASLVFSAVAALTAALHPGIRPSAVVTFLSERSLALYCIHPFFLAPLLQLVASLSGTDLVRRNAAVLAIVASSYAVDGCARYVRGKMRALREGGRGRGPEDRGETS